MTDLAPDSARGRLTGRKVLAIGLGWFAVVLGANLVLVFIALGSFSGLVTDNAYRAGQLFDAEAKAEQSLGWRLGADWRDGRVAVSVRDADGAPVQGLTVTGTVGRKVTNAEDREVAFSPAGEVHVAELSLAPGVWRVEIRAVRRYDGARYVIMDQVEVPEAASR